MALTIMNPQSVLSTCIDSSSQALTTAFGLCAVYCLWLGVFEVADKCRLVEKLSLCFEGLNRWLYGNVEKVASDYISLNLASNLLGVGNAATPSAIAAINVLEKDEKLSRAGAMLFVVNATSVQLIPTTVIGIRASMGSVNASDILLPNLISTLITSVVGVALVFVFYGKATPTESTRFNGDVSIPKKLKGATTPNLTGLTAEKKTNSLRNDGQPTNSCPAGEAAR